MRDARADAAINVWQSVTKQRCCRRVEWPTPPPPGVEDGPIVAAYREAESRARSENVANVRAVLTAARMLLDGGLHSQAEDMREHIFAQWGLRVDVPHLLDCEAVAQRLVRKMPLATKYSRAA